MTTKYNTMKTAEEYAKEFNEKHEEDLNEKAFLEGFEDGKKGMTSEYKYDWELKDYLSLGYLRTDEENTRQEFYEAGVQAGYKRIRE